MSPALSDAHRLRALEQENARLKKLLADQMLDNPVLSVSKGPVLSVSNGPVLSVSKGPVLSVSKGERS